MRRPLPSASRASPTVRARPLALGPSTRSRSAYSSGFFRRHVSSPRRDWDAWAFWVPKAKIIYFFGRIERRRSTTLGRPSYPLLRAGARRDGLPLPGVGRHDADRVQYWLLLVGFVAATAALLRGLAPRVVRGCSASAPSSFPSSTHRLLSGSETGRSTSCSASRRSPSPAGSSARRPGRSRLRVSCSPRCSRRNAKGQLLAACSSSRRSPVSAGAPALLDAALLASAAAYR